MITLFLLITLVSLTLAGGMATVVARVLREERRRSDARVAALSRMAMDDFLPEPEPASAPAAFPLEPSAETPLVASTGMFEEAAPASPWGARLTIAGVLLSIVLVVFVSTSFRSPAIGSRPGSRQAEMTTSPLQLLALGHTQNDGSLTVAGRVQNPRDGQPVSSLTATVFLFGQDGSFLTSGRSPLDVPALAAGVESAFAVTIPVHGAVARYRVSFRDASGRPVAHVDRRNAAALARNE
jgi:hypothetical protein